MNDVLKAINFKVKAVNVNDGRTWSVVHPNGSLPFSDNMVIGTVDPIVDASRVHAVLNAAQECSISCFECVTPASNRPAPSQHLSQDPIQDQPNKKNINPAASAAQPSIAQPSSSAQASKPPPTLMRALLNSVQQAGPAHALASHASPPLSTLSTPTRAPVTAHSTDHQSCNAPVASSQISASDDDLCVICYTDKKEMVAIPCGHVILCTSCSENEKLMKDMKNVCPICRSKIDCVVFIG